MQDRLTEPRPRLFLGECPRLEIPLPSERPGSPRAWLVIGLPGPLSDERLDGSFVADPRIPECEIVFRWGQAHAVPRVLSVLSVTAGGRSWSLVQDVCNPERWLEQDHSDRDRLWS